ncbi:hypothetical protein [Hymenobacter montanus]|uniref:hypothetical protein n=1 Tax=Hymenobacter montanus TaxID=2771359 RepID=UPI001CC2EDB3|nr:hypothetical protein [Hymenobacter montanus]
MKTRKRFEYRIEQVIFDKGESRDQQLLDLLNYVGQEGWRVSSLVVEPRLASNESKIKVLLEREVDDEGEVT